MTLGPQFDESRFSIEDQGTSPLSYNRGGGPRRRLGLVHPDVADLPVNRLPRRVPVSDPGFGEYFRRNVLVGVGESGRALKTPRVVANPNAASPKTAAFLDFHQRGDDSIYIDYLNRRSDLGGIGAAGRLIHGLAGRFPEHELDFGRVMSPKVWDIASGLESSGRRVRRIRDF